MARHKMTIGLDVISWKHVLMAVALTLTASVAVIPTAPAWSAIVHGTMVANDRDDIYDDELAAMINAYIPTYGSMILAFTECYGGDKMDDFAGKANTAVLSGSTPGTTTDYGGYHAGLSQSLKPGTDTDSAHAAADAAKKSGDHPNKAGANQNIGIQGSITSTHVLVWAGKPNGQDQTDINNIAGNFPDNGTSQTVTVLSGGGGGANVDGAATRANLKQALKDIGAKMNANEQFILFVTDHGDIDHGAQAAVTPGTTNVPIDIPLPVLAQLQADPGNEPSLDLVSQQQIETELVALNLISVNGLPIYTGGGPSSFFDVFVELPVNLDETPQPELYHYVTKPGVISDSLLLPDNTVSFGNFTTSFFDVFVSLDSGGVSRLPEPATLGLLLIGGSTLLLRRRQAA